MTAQGGGFEKECERVKYISTKELEKHPSWAASRQLTWYLCKYLAGCHKKRGYRKWQQQQQSRKIHDSATYTAHGKLGTTYSSLLTLSSSIMILFDPILILIINNLGGGGDMTAQRSAPTLEIYPKF